jgi:hypothetical protein
MKTGKSEHGCVMKFFFLSGKRYNARDEGLGGVLREAGVSLVTVKRWCQCFKAGIFSLDDGNKPRRSLSDFSQAISQFLRNEPFLSERVLAKSLATSPPVITAIIPYDLGMRKFART